jgi:hypothetical protein
MSTYPLYTQGVKIKPVTVATNKAASLDEELGDITSYEFGEPIDHCY